MLKISKNIKYICTAEKEIFYRRRVRENSTNFKRKNLNYTFLNLYYMFESFIKKKVIKKSLF